MTEVLECLRTLPRKIKLGAYDWTVDVQTSDEDRCGYTDFETRVVTLWSDNLTSPAHAVGIALHECLHVIFDNEKLGKLKKDKEAREEQIVLGFEAGLVSLLRDNPKLRTWINRWLKSNIK